MKRDMESELKRGTDEIVKESKGWLRYETREKREREERSKDNGKKRMEKERDK